jgi:hypothetical protein
MMARWVTRRTRRTIASLSATMTSRATATTTSTKVIGTTRGIQENASQTKKSRLFSAIHGARSRGTIKYNFRKSCTNGARCTRSQSIHSSCVPAFACHSMLHSFLKTKSGRIRGMMTRVISQGLNTSKTQRMPSTSSSAETVASLRSSRRS